MDLSLLVHKSPDDLRATLLTFNYPTLRQFIFGLDYPRITEIISPLNNDFWQQKFCQDYGSPTEKVSSWYDHYLQQSAAWIWSSFPSEDRTKNPRIIPDLSSIKSTDFLKVRSISTGQDHLLLTQFNGQVVGIGRNDCYQLGMDYPPLASLPTQLPRFNCIVQMACGLNHTLALDDQGRVWVSGSNQYGQLGLGAIERSNHATPVLLEIIANERSVIIQKVVAHSNHSLLLSQSGQVYVMGDNQSNQLGLGSVSQAIVPTHVILAGMDRIVDLATGVNHSLLLSEKGTVFSCGQNTYGQLGFNLKQSRCYPISIHALPPAASIAAGSYHSLVVDRQNRVWVFGLNHSGQLGLNNRNDILSEESTRFRPEMIPELSGIVSVSGGHEHSLFLDWTGQVWMCGSKKTTSQELSPGLDQPVKIPHLSNIGVISSQGYQNLALGWNVLQRISREEFRQMSEQNQIKAVKTINISAEKQGIVVLDHYGYQYLAQLES